MAIPPELRTLRDWLRYAVSRFNEAGLCFGHGSDNAWDEAVYLLLHTLHLPLDRLEPFLDATLTADECARLAAMLRRRVEDRVPAAYITGEAWLGEFRFQVDENVIVPRSFFAELLRDGFSPWIADPSQVEAALDLCTGSGCLAILMAHAFPHGRIDAVDISAPALQVAARNVADYDLQDQVRLVRSDLFDGLPPRRYDLILSNPPYVTDEAMAALPPEYRHEPALALGAGPQGLDIVHRILTQAGRWLTPEGVLAIEVGHNRELVEIAYPDLPLTWLSCDGHDDAVFLVEAQALQTGT
jgi:ribosomal protein L3 glutamine methyltransferase